MNTYDVVIIGAGIVGANVAHELSKYKLKVCILEKEAEPAFGVSKSNSGIIHSGFHAAPGTLKAKYCYLGNKLTRKICKELKVDLAKVGEIVVGFNKQDISKLQKLKEQGEKLGIKDLKLLNKKELFSLEPNLNKKAAAGLLAPNACSVSPFKLVNALINAAQANGVKLYCENEVLGINRGMPCHSGVNKNGNTGISSFIIKTNKYSIRSKVVINCAGLYADKIAKMVGVKDIQIKPRKGEEYILDHKVENQVSHIIFPLPTKVSKGILVIKTAEGNIMCGPTAWDQTDKEDMSTSAQGMAEVFKGAAKLIPSVRRSDIIAYFAGLRPAEKNGDFIIRHEKKVPGFINVAGIQSPGLTAAPAIARDVVEMLLEQLNLSQSQKIKTHAQRPALRSSRRGRDCSDIVCRCETISAAQIKQAIKEGARTLDGVKFRTHSQAGRCHGAFCTPRIMEILAKELNIPIEQASKRGKGSEIVKEKL